MNRVELFKLKSLMASMKRGKSFYMKITKIAADANQRLQSFEHGGAIQLSQ